MPIIFFANKDEAVKVVSSIHYQPDLLDTQTKSSGVEVDSVPEPENRPGKAAVLKYSEADGLYYEYVDRPLTQDEEIELLKKQNASLMLMMAELQSKG